MSRRGIMTALLLALSSCTGSVPTSGTLPKLDGGQLTGVSAAKVGDYTADQVADGTKTVLGATDSAAASTLVKRDASGSFSAGTITATFNGNLTGDVTGKASSATVADYAMGQQGSDLNSAATLTLTSDGNFFKVKGMTDISKISTRPAGQKIQLLFDGTTGSSRQLKLINGTSLKLSGGGDFWVYPGDYFEFVSDGANWREVSRSVQHDSRVYAYASVSDNVPSGNKVPGETVLHFGKEIFDYQDEYDTGSGGFVAKQNGEYQITATMWIPAVWNANEYCTLVVRDVNFPAGGGSETLYQATVMPGGSSNCVVALTGTIHANAGDTILPAASIHLNPDPVGGAFYATMASVGFQYLMITRLRN